MVHSAINIGILDTLNSPPFIPPQARGRDFWVYSVCSIYNKCLASQPLNGLLGNKYWYFGHPKFTPLYPPRKRGEGTFGFILSVLYIINV